MATQKPAKAITMNRDRETSNFVIFTAERADAGYIAKVYMPKDDAKELGLNGSVTVTFTLG